MGCGGPSKHALDDGVGQTGGKAGKSGSNGSRSNKAGGSAGGQRAASSSAYSGANGIQREASRQPVAKRRSYRRANSEGSISAASSKKGRRNKGGSKGNTKGITKGDGSAGISASSGKGMPNGSGKGHIDGLSIPTGGLGGGFESLHIHPTTFNDSSINSSTPTPKDDPHWMALWKAFSASLLDPTDVHATLDDLMAQTTNNLTTTELTFLQRKVRKVVRSLPKGKSNTSNGAATRVGRILNSATSNANSDKGDANGGATNRTYSFQDASDAEARLVADRHHLLTAAVIKKVLPTIPADLTPACNPTENAYILMLFLNNDIWDTVAKIAKDDAMEAGLEMDVNKLIKMPTDAMLQARPVPSLPIAEPFVFPHGASLSSLAFLVALALRGSRTQRLQLLFYLLLPPETLLAFLQAHPAGGVPTWLLEVGSSTVISISSLSHYHIYGDVFLPGRKRSPNIPSTSPDVDSSASTALSVDALHANHILQSLLRSKPKRRAKITPLSSAFASSGPGSPAFNGKDGPQSPVRKTPSLGLIRRGSNHKEANGSDHAASAGANKFKKSEVMEQLHSTAVKLVPLPTAKFSSTSEVSASSASSNSSFDGTNNGTQSPYSSGLHIDLEGQWNGLLEAMGSSGTADGSRIDMVRFCQLAESALNDVALDVIMDRIFATGVLPDRQLEYDMVKTRWHEWENIEGKIWRQPGMSGADIAAPKTNGSNSNHNSYSNGSSSGHRRGNSSSNGNKSGGADNFIVPNVFGGIGGVDGLGAMGTGIMYAIDKKWWDNWIQFVGWSWADDPDSARETRQLLRERPSEISTERLLDRSGDTFVPGTMGSYEQMRPGLRRDVDFVLVPPPVWDALYEMYGGGPPLPRIAIPSSALPEEQQRQRQRQQQSNGPRVTQNLPGPNGDVELKIATTVDDFDGMAAGETKANGRVARLPQHLSICTHPWVLHVHLCDPQQPYRRGDAGPMSIRVMVMPNQPLWRFYAELITRLPFHLYQSFNTTGRGRARLWKRTEPASAKDAMARYGPWALLCKNRFAILPVQNMYTEISENFEQLKKDWLEYTDDATIESMDIADGDQFMIECAVLNRSDEFMWPREAAAKAGLEKRLAESELKFRQLLQGIDNTGQRLANPPDLVGLSIDAMDSSGRWYPVDIARVRLVAHETDEEDEDDEDSMEDGPISPRGAVRPTSESKEVLVDFTEHGGHEQWIDVESDQLAAAGRFTLGKQEDAPEPTGKKGSGNGNNSKPKYQAMQVKKVAADANEANGRACALPGYGACGLSNLGNTCYINSAIQCIGYMPLLRSYLLSGQFKAQGDLNQDNPLGTGGKLLEVFVELLRQMWMSKHGEKSPSRFRSQLGKACSQFAGADQQDAQEYLNYMLDVLHEDSNRVRNKPYVEGLEDEWVENSSLRRVGDEAWRRFLRRNRSIMADVAMGQVLSTVTCPVCHFSSKNFDPFNLLSVPFPTVANVIFQCYVVRRASAINTPWILNKPRKGNRFRTRFVRRDLIKDPKPPSEQYIIEQYVIALSRLADSGDLKLQLQNLCGIPATKLKICRAEEVEAKGKNDGTVIRRHTKVTPLTDKEGPCSQLIRRGNGDDAVTGQSGPALIVAFETTLRPRPVELSKDIDDISSDSADDLDEEEQQASKSRRELSDLERHIEVYGNAEECRVYDTPTISVAKAISRSTWPRTEDELKLGLRVDAIDHRGNWFPGSVVEIIERAADDKEGKEAGGAGGDVDDDGGVEKLKVRVHFDNFSSKWDETYSIDHFTEGHVRPLYSHAVPRPKPTEFMVHHRFTDRVTRANTLFGQSFYVQCHNDWTTARAGAQILAQAARFLHLSAEKENHMKQESSPEHLTRATRLYERTQAVISDLIDLLIDVDREYVQYALGVAPDPNADPAIEVDRFRNPGYDATKMSSMLLQKVNAVIHRLPFEMRVCTVDAAVNGRGNDEVAFPFSLMRSIGNYMSSKHTVVLQWREPPTDKKATNGKPSNYLNAPVMYTAPKLAIDQISAKILDDAIQKKKQAAKSMNNGGLKLGVCLTEFCKVQQLSINDNWRCPRCRDFREGKQNLELWRLPDLLTFHIKRFNCSARWREKISMKVNFPLTGLDMTEWCHKESPVRQTGANGDEYVYDLIGVLNHYGSMTGGHYVATCKATACGRDGFEEVAHDFNGVGVGKPVIPSEDNDVPSGWRLGWSKTAGNQNKPTAAAASKAAANSSEPLWLQFDDDLVEPIPPRHVVSEMAYVLFYRRRRITPANVAKYSTLE